MTTLYEHWSDIPERAWRWGNFTPKELACRHTGALLLVPETLDRLQALRSAYGQAMVITSAYRSPDHPAERGKTSTTGAHPRGRGFDIHCYGDVLRLITLAREHGFTGIGVKQHGDIRGRFIHIDDLPEAEERPRPWLWSYT